MDDKKKKVKLDILKQLIDAMREKEVEGWKEKKEEPEEKEEEACEGESKDDEMCPVCGKKHEKKGIALIIAGKKPEKE
jgi:hypothetical protein